MSEHEVPAMREKFVSTTDENDDVDDRLRKIARKHTQPERLTRLERNELNRDVVLGEIVQGIAELKVGQENQKQGTDALAELVGGALAAVSQMEKKLLDAHGQAEKRLEAKIDAVKLVAGKRQRAPLTHLGILITTVLAAIGTVVTGIIAASKGSPPPDPIPAVAPASPHAH